MKAGDRIQIGTRSVRVRKGLIRLSGLFPLIQVRIL